MKLKVLVLIFLMVSVLSCSQRNEDDDLKSLIISQLINTHSNQEWFVPTNTALDGLTYEQAIWKDSTTNHSIAELATHISFWNEMNLRSFKDLEIPDEEIKNEETFQTPTESEWLKTLKRLDSIQTEWEVSVEKSNDIKIKEWSEEITNMTAHTSYHTGQIVYLRKQKGWWK
nr:DinB family protein [uncultured Allomuricauda sp.]